MNFKKRFLLLFMLVLVGVLTFPVQAETMLGDELVEQGDFEFNTGTEIRLPDPVFGVEYGVANGWGSLSFDSAAIATVDPDDPDNTVLKLSYSDDTQGFSSFFRFLTFTASTTYNISIDFKIVGTTDNMGFRFAGPVAGTVVQVYNHASKTEIVGKPGWYNVQFTYDSGTDNFDSIALWFNTLSSQDNYALVDNITVKAQGTETNINAGGDFEGFLDYAPQAALTAAANEYGFYGENGTVGNGDVQLADSGLLGYEVVTDSGIYQVGFTFSIADITDADVDLAFATETVFDLGLIALVTDGVIDTDYVTEAAGLYTVLVDVTKAAATSVTISYAGSSTLVIDNLSVKEVIEIPENPFDPEKTYYEGDNLIVNGDFEAFAEGTVFSEAQLEGAWGSVSLDGPAKIASVGDTKVMSIGQTAGKTYSSAFVITPPELQVDDLIRVEYDYKLDLEGDVATYQVINTSFVGISNVSYYTIDLKSIVDGGLSSGAELLHMPLVVTDLGDGWFNVQLDLQVDAQLLIKCNSIRFLFTPQAATDKLLIDNVAMYYLSDVAPVVEVESLNIPEGDQELEIGEEVQLSVTIDPSNADDQTVVWSSTNTDVATVDNTGKVEAIGTGACTITVETSDGEVSDSIVVSVIAESVVTTTQPGNTTTEPVVTTEPVDNQPLGAGGIVAIVAGGIVLLAGAAFLVLKLRGPRV